MIFNTNNTGDLGPQNCQRMLEVVRSIPGPANFVDLGVRLGVSSRILMNDAEAKGNHTYGVEAIGCAPELADLLARPNYHFISGDSVTTGMDWPIGKPIHIVMFDTFHFAQHVLCELYSWWQHIAVGGYAILHDTNWDPSYHDCYAGMSLPHVIKAVDEFFPSDIERRSYPESFGMTFVKKNSDKDYVERLSEARWREIFGIRRKVMQAVNLPISWKDYYQ